ncbi:MAG: hypothetical protein IPJ65_14750 [Archangiaceae bacterium]|nr:hypothetical protein [Archangiaceae bacterium]
MLIIAAAPQKLAAVGFSHANVAESVAEVASDHFAQQLSGQGFRVVTAKELAALIGIERQKQLLGCADSDSSCLAELTNALGTDALVTGSIGRFGARFTVNIRVTAATDGAALAVFSSEVGSEDELPATLSRAAADIAGQLRPRAVAPLSQRIGIGAGFGVSLAMLIASGICLALTASAWSRLTSGVQPAESAFRDRVLGESLQTPGWALLGLGLGGVLVTSIVVLALGEAR